MVYNQKKLARISKALLMPEIDYLVIAKTIGAYKNLCIEASGLDTAHVEYAENIHLPSGKAIGPKWAGMCLEDSMRTKRFVCAIDAAIEDIRKIKTEPVTILYTGTGPFATLVLPLTAKYTAAQLQFVFLEVNPASIQSLEKVITSFGIEEYVNALHCCDAATYQLPNDTNADIVLIECLQHALAREPQVAITYNLLPQLNKDVVLIPSEITLYPSLVNAKKEEEVLMEVLEAISETYFEHLAPVFVLNKEIVLSTKNKNATKLFFPQVETTFLETQLEDKTQLVVHTKMVLYKDHQLFVRESGLTIPLLVTYLDQGSRPKVLLTQYIVGSDPYLKTELIY